MLPFSDGEEGPGVFVCKIFTPFSRMVNIFYSQKWYQNFDFSWTCSSHRNTVSNEWQVDSRTTRKHKGIATVFFRGETEKKKKNDTITENKIDDVITNLTVGSLYRAL